MSNQQRVQAPELAAPERLQSPGLPGDTFTGAPQPVKDNNLANIADALGSFNTNLHQFGTAFAHQQKAQQKVTDQGNAANILGGTTDEDLIARRESGAFSGKPVGEQLFLNKGYANALAAQDKANIDAAVTSGDIKLTSDNPISPPPSIDQATVALMKPTMEKLANDPVARNVYVNEMATHRAALRNKQAEAQATQTNMWRTDMVDRSIGQVLDMSPSPEAAHNLMREAYRELGPGTPANMPLSELDKRALAVITNRASATPAGAEQALYLLQAPRSDLKTGQPMPPMKDTPGLYEKTQGVIKSATDTMQTAWTTGAKQVAATDALDKFKRADGSFGATIDAPVTNPYKDVSAGPEMVKAEDARKNAVQTFLAQSTAQSQRDNETPKTTFDREFNAFAGNFVEHPVWKETLKSGAGSLMNQSAMSDPSKQKQAIAAGELFNNLAEKNYPYAKSMMDKSTADTWDTYRTLRQMGHNPQQAILETSQAVSTPETDGAKEQRAHMAKAVADKIGAGTNFGTSIKSMMPFFSDTAYDTSLIRQQVLDQATVMTRVPGLGPDEAIKAATKNVTDHAVLINGYLVNDPNGQVKENKPVIEGLLKQFADVHGTATGVHSASELSVSPAGGGNYYVWSREDGVGPGHPVYLNDKPAMITGAGEGNDIQKMKDHQSSLNALRTEEASRNSALHTVVATPNARLSPDQLAAKQTELKRQSDAFSETVRTEGSKAIQRIGGTDPVAMDNMKAQTENMKATANRVLGFLHNLGAAVGKNLVPYGEMQTSTLPKM